MKTTTFAFFDSFTLYYIKSQNIIKILGQNESNFAHLPWKLENPYYHNIGRTLNNIPNLPDTS